MNKGLKYFAENQKRYHAALSTYGLKDLATVKQWYIESNVKFCS